MRSFWLLLIELITIFAESPQIPPLLSIFSEELTEPDVQSDSVWDVILIILGSFVFVAVMFVLTRFCIRDSICSLKIFKKTSREEPV